MANPFYVAPLGGMQTYQNVGNSIAGGINQYQENQALEQEQAKKQQLMQQASQVMERGNPQEIAQFSMQYPDIGAAMQGGITFANDVTKENMKQSMQKVIAGGDAAQILQERIEIVESNGGDATQSREELNVLSRMGADQYRSMVGNIYSMQYGVEGVPQGPKSELIDTGQGYAVYSPDKGFTALNGAPISPNQLDAKIKRDANNFKMQLEGMKAGQEQAGEKIKRADDLRSEVTKKAKELGIDKTFAAINRIEASNNGSAAGDLSLIFNYMKLLDPGSVVREGEFATAQNATGVPQRILNVYNQAMTGERMSEDQRENFTDQSRRIYKQAKESFEDSISPYIDLADQSGIQKDELLGKGFFDSFSVAGNTSIDDLVNKYAD
jgi:hypothetical protein